MLIDTPLLVLGRGPAALLVARLASGAGISNLLAGHEPLGGEEPVVLDAEAVEVLTPDGVLDVLRPYLATTSPPSITAAAFEEVLKHHCVADMGITVFDGLDLVERAPRGNGVTGVLSDGRSRWEISADAFVDAADLPRDVAGAIPAAAATVSRILTELRSAREPS